MKIYLIRHGETDWNLQGRLQGREDIPLNQTGILQAEACGEALRAVRLDSIHTSPLMRAEETAEIIAAWQQCPVIVNSELIERDYGRRKDSASRLRDSLPEWNRGKHWQNAH